MVCPHCKAENAKDAKRCTSCGKSLARGRKTGLITALVIVVFVIAVVIWLIPFYTGPADAILAKALEPYAQARSFRGEAKAVRVGGPEHGSTITADWKLSLAYQRPDRAEASLSSPAESHHYVWDGTNLYAHQTAVDRVNIYQQAQNREMWDVVGVIFGVMGGGWRGSVVAESDPKHAVMSVKKAGVGFVGARPVQVLRVECDPAPYHSSAAIVERLWVKPGGGILREEVSRITNLAVRREKASSITRITWTKQELNPSLDAKTFVFTMPKKGLVRRVGPEWWDERSGGGKK